MSYNSALKTLIYWDHINKLFINNNTILFIMKYEFASKEEERYLQTKESIINNLYDQKDTEKRYLETVGKLLEYWKKELGSVDSQSKERHEELLKLIDTEESTIGKIKEDIRRINEMIDKTENNLEKIQKMVTSLRKES